MTTYGYSEPDPVAAPGTIYPYWTFGQFSITPEQQSWKMVVLENPYIRVKIFPEIGGKVWSIRDKTSGRELVYDNDAVKFRDIALRGPWTSGGIEFNYGTIGHAPSCAAPVDWKTETKADGSVSCYVGVLEMTSRSRWTVEINLPKDAACCRTRSIWYNISGDWQPFYSWANSAVETTADLQLIFPACNAVGHYGELQTYPLNEDGKDISLLSNQAYGMDKSYHMIGSHKSYFGVYYPSADWGSLHWSLRDEKLGRKYFSWAQSSQGTIWIDLLTDNRAQYVELQSGKLFNQNLVESSNTPYRQILFSPYGTEEWSDYWFPFSGIGTVDNATLSAVSSVKSKGKKTLIGIYPVREFSGPLSVIDADGNSLYSQAVNLTPGKSINFNVKGKAEEIRLGGKTIWKAEDEQVDRPQTRDSEFKSGSLNDLVLYARDYAGMRMYDKAEESADKALSIDGTDIDALCIKAALLYRRMAYAEAYEYSDKALSIDEYCPEAGYFGALSALALGKEYDAMDRFEVASISESPLRSACYTELSRIHFRHQENELAEAYARKALYSNGRNLTALMILSRLNGEGKEQIGSIDPLSHFPAAEDLLAGKIDARTFAGSFQEELPWEDFIELALFYRSLGQEAEAARILDAVQGSNILTELWKAYLLKDTAAIESALKADMDFAFPFRAESAAMLEWVNANSTSWKGRYLLALLKDFMGYREEAFELVKGNESDYAPYYAYRFSLSKDIADFRKAFELRPDDGIYRRRYALGLIAVKDYSGAIGLLKDYYAAHPEDFKAGDALIDAYMGSNQWLEAEKIADSIVFLPYEGQKDSHRKYRSIKMQLAREAKDAGQYERALKLVDQALEWPERLGAGKPYDYLIDTSEEEALRKEIQDAWK